MVCVGYTRDLCKTACLHQYCSNLFLVAVKNLGPLLDNDHHLIKQTGSKQIVCTVDLQETVFLYKHISVAIQNYNALSHAKLFIPKSLW